MSTENLYNELIISFLNRIGFLQGAIYHLNSDIKGFEKNYKESREDSQDIDFRLGTKLELFLMFQEKWIMVIHFFTLHLVATQLRFQSMKNLTIG